MKLWTSGLNPRADRCGTKLSSKPTGRSWAEFAEDLKALADKGFPELQEDAKVQLALQNYLQQLDHPPAGRLQREAKATYDSGRGSVGNDQDGKLPTPSPVRPSGRRGMPKRGQTVRRGVGGWSCVRGCHDQVGQPRRATGGEGGKAGVECGPEGSTVGNGRRAKTIPPAAGNEWDLLAVRQTRTLCPELYRPRETSYPWREELSAGG